ncbi:MAG: RnfABCDGE type electron transport complex subunit D [Brevinema sp.]
MAEIYSEKLLQEFPYADKTNLSRKIIIHFIIAMLFPTAAGFYYFGFAMLRTLFACIIFSMLTEWVLNKIMQKESTLGDLTAIAIGMVIALNMRPGLGIYPLLITCVVGIAVGKIIFGGAGFNPINPAVVGRLVPVAGFPGLWATAIRPTIPNLMEYAGLTYWEAVQYTFVRDVKALPFYDQVLSAQPAHAPYSFSQEINTYYDVLSGTTYLETIKNWYKSGVMPEGMMYPTEFFDYWTLFLGNIPGTLGETSKLAILLGFVYLVLTKVITPLVPLMIWVFMGIFGWVFSATRLGPAEFGPLGFFAGDPMIWILAGGAMMGSVYMETDPVSSPRTLQAKVLYSLIFVTIVSSIRLVFSFPEGVSFGLLGSNLTIPFLDKLCNPNYKYAKQITKCLIGVGIFIAVFLVGMFIFKTFISPTVYNN